MALLFVALLATLKDSDAGMPVERVGLVGGTVLVLMLDAVDRMVTYLRWPDLAVMLGMAVLVSSRASHRPAWVTDRIIAGSIVLLCVTTIPVWVWI
ncbi:MAG: hypothetical protein U5K30_00630 [Acidimicrobiales bacterium]|nr:hypothetical protein [Acidimicrobiales bacterium]